MEKKQNVPALRFQGFSGEWKRQKFGEVATFINGRAYAQSELLSAGKYKVLRVGNFYTNSTWYYSNLELSDKYYANRGDLLYTWSATFGPHIWDGDKVIYHYHIWKIEVKEQLEKLFFLQLLERDKKNLLNDTNGSTMVHITKLGMENKTDFIPNNIDEQSKIGQFCSQINCKIEKEKRKIQKLQQFRQAMLTKLFPREGAAEPELRFRGFSGKWASKSFGKLFDMLPTNTLSRSDLNNKCGKIRNVHYGDILVKYNDLIDVKDKDLPFISRNIEVKMNALLKDGDIIIADTAEDMTVGKCVEMVNVGKGKVVSGLHTIACRPLESFAPGFLGYFFNSHLYHNQLIPLMQGIKVTSISKTALKSTVVYFPSEIEEQKRIGQFFMKLDSYISLQQKKLERMQRLKAALLEKLFV